MIIVDITFKCSKVKISAYGNSFMENIIKSTASNLQHVIKKAFNSDVKISHAHAAISGYLGFNSKKALKAHYGNHYENQSSCLTTNQLSHIQFNLDKLIENISRMKSTPLKLIDPVFLGITIRIGIDPYFIIPSQAFDFNAYGKNLQALKEYINLMETKKFGSCFVATDKAHRHIIEYSRTEYSKASSTDKSKILNLFCSILPLNGRDDGLSLEQRVKHYRILFDTMLSTSRQKDVVNFDHDMRIINTYLEATFPYDNKYHISDWRSDEIVSDFIRKSGIKLKV